MRFLKKASIDNIGDFVREHNDFELYLRRDDITDINDSFEKLKKFLVKNKKRQYVVENKDTLQAAVLMQNSSLEIVKDATLDKNQCLIETGGGVFDCGLDTQLENLIDNIKALSCM